MFSIKRIIALPVLLFSLFATPFETGAHAQVLNETQSFDFGRWMVTNNSAPHHITVNTDGSYSNSSELIMLDPPRPGVYEVTGLPQFAVINSVNITMTQEMSSGAPEDFDLDNFTYLLPNADINGVSQLILGARARTTGGGGSYPDAVYTGELNVDINF